MCIKINSGIIKLTSKKLAEINVVFLLADKDIHIQTFNSITQTDYNYKHTNSIVIYKQVGYIPYGFAWHIIKKGENECRVTQILHAARIAINDA